MGAINSFSTQPRLGFIGLGYLGSRIARRLIDGGFPLTVYDLDPARAAQFSTLARVAQSASDLAREVNCVLSCLPDGAAVEATYMGGGKVLESGRRGMGVIELSTISPETARLVHQAGRDHGISVLDVAVSGSTQAAEAGILTLFGGGNLDDFEVAEPIFRAIAKQWFFMGPSGSGVAMKLVVNALLGIGMQAIAESVALGSALGLSRDLLFDTLAKTAVIAPAHLGKLSSARRNDYSPQFPVRLMRKDFGLILAQADTLSFAMPVTEAAAVVNELEAAGGDEEDFSAVVRRMEIEARADRVVTPAG
jgi:3-hydroxyisobutyrate dehydrogenase-like beta-hydroxyacid dehydrogenase